MLKDEFLLEQFKCLRVEIMDHIAAQRHIEIASIIAIATIYGFLLTNENLPEWAWLAWFVPPIISGFGLARMASYHIQIGFIAEYLRMEEKRIEPSTGLWENFIAEKRANDPRASRTGKTFILSFAALLSGSLVISALAVYFRF